MKAAPRQHGAAPHVTQAPSAQTYGHAVCCVHWRLSLQTSMFVVLQRVCPGVQPPPAQVASPTLQVVHAPSRHVLPLHDTGAP